MTDSTKMTLEQVRDALHNLAAHYPMEGLDPDFRDLADAIDSHLAPREVSDEDVERAINTCIGWVQAVACNGSLASAAIDDIKRTLAALQADRQRGGGVTHPSVWDYCPECGSDEVQSREGECNYCAVCGQDYYDSIDYTGAVMSNLSRMHKAHLAQRGQVREGCDVRLWDTQWINIVNHDNAYRDWSKEEAIAHAVKMTEKAIARNVADGKLPPSKSQAPDADTEGR